MHNSATVCVANGEIRAPWSAVCKGEGRAMERKTEILISFMWQDGSSHPHSIINYLCGSHFPPCPLRCHWAGGTNSIAPWSRWMLLLPVCVLLPWSMASLVWCGRRVHGQCGRFRCCVVRIVFPPRYLCLLFCFTVELAWSSRRDDPACYVTLLCCGRLAHYLVCCFHVAFVLLILCSLVAVDSDWGCSSNGSHTHTHTLPLTHRLGLYFWILYEMLPYLP